MISSASGLVVSSVSELLVVSSIGRLLVSSAGMLIKVKMWRDDVAVSAKAFKPSV